MFIFEVRTRSPLYLFLVVPPQKRIPFRSGLKYHLVCCFKSSKIILQILTKVESHLQQISNSAIILFQRSFFSTKKARINSDFLLLTTLNNYFFLREFTSVSHIWIMHMFLHGWHFQLIFQHLNLVRHHSRRIQFFRFFQ